jgi:hypothetical protein
MVHNSSRTKKGRGDRFKEEIEHLCSVGGCDALPIDPKKSPSHGVNELNVSGEAANTTALNQAKIVDKQLEKAIKPITYQVNFILGVASRFLLETRSKERDELYAQQVREAIRSIKANNSLLLKSIVRDLECTNALQELLRSVFLVGLVSDRDGLSPAEAEQIFRKKQSSRGNNKRWIGKEELREKLRPIVAEFVLIYNSEGRKPVGLHEKAIENFIDGDERFQVRLDEYRIEREYITNNMLIELFREARPC